MFLSSEQIKKAVKQSRLGIQPFSEKNLKPVSYTFTLGDILKNPNTGREIRIPEKGYKLPPGEFIIGQTTEHVKLYGNYICFLSTRSSLAQQGIDVLQSSTVAEPDTDGHLTVEITNHGPKKIILNRGMRIVKGIFSQVQT